MSDDFRGPGEEGEAFDALYTLGKKGTGLKVRVGKGTWEIRPCKAYGIMGYAIIGSPFREDRWMPCKRSAEDRLRRRVAAGELKASGRDSDVK